MLGLVKRYARKSLNIDFLKPAAPAFKPVPPEITDPGHARGLLAGTSHIEIRPTERWQRLPLESRHITLVGRVAPTDADTNSMACRVRYLDEGMAPLEDYGVGLSFSARAGGYFYPQRHVIDEGGTFERALTAPEDAAHIEINTTLWRKSASKVRACRRILMISRPATAFEQVSDSADPLPACQIDRRLSSLPEASILAAARGQLAGMPFVDIPRRDYWQVLNMDGTRHWRLLALCRNCEASEQGDMIVRFRFFDRAGRSLIRKVPGLAHSERAGHYRYLTRDAGRGIISETFLAPAEASRMAVSVQTWRQIDYRPRISSTLLLLPLE